MHVSRVQIGEIKLLRRGAEVAVSVHVALELTIDRCDQSIAADIKLAVVDQQRFVKVFLHNRRPIAVQ